MKSSKTALLVIDSCGVRGITTNTTKKTPLILILTLGSLGVEKIHAQKTGLAIELMCLIPRHRRKPTTITMTIILAAPSATTVHAHILPGKARVAITTVYGTGYKLLFIYVLRMFFVEPITGPCFLIAGPVLINALLL